MADCTGSELMRKALALMSDGQIRSNVEMSEAIGAIPNSLSKICRTAVRAGLFSVTHRTRRGSHVVITDLGLERCADIDRTAIDVTRMIVRLPSAPRQWFEV